MLDIDGAFGEGGGQILRTSLALALVTGTPIKIRNIRKGRKRPGLMRQHLASVLAAAQIGNANVEGATLGSTKITLHPGPVTTGDFHFRIGTAGSATLVLQTVLPALMVAQTDGEHAQSTITVEGGTHNPFAPPFDFLDEVWCPLVNQLGPQVTLELERPGFFPAGGGQIRATVLPTRIWQPLELLERGPLKATRARALIAHLGRRIGERECNTVRDLTGWAPECFEIRDLRNSKGPGNVVVISMAHEHVSEVVCSFGEVGLRAETVAERAAREALAYLETGIPVGEHLADQLLLPLALAAWRTRVVSRFRTGALSSHTTTNIDTIQRFLDVKISATEKFATEKFATEQAAGDYIVEVAHK